MRSRKAKTIAICLTIGSLPLDLGASWIHTAVASPDLLPIGGNRSEVIASEVQSRLERLARTSNIDPMTLRKLAVTTKVRFDKDSSGGTIGIGVGGGSLTEQQRDAFVDALTRYVHLRAIGLSKPVVDDLVLKRASRRNLDPATEHVVKQFPDFRGATFYSEEELYMRSPVLPRPDGHAILRGIVDQHIAIIFRVDVMKDGTFGKVTAERRDSREFNPRLAKLFSEGVATLNVAGGESLGKVESVRLKKFLESRGLAWRLPENLLLRILQ